ncbi:group 3 secretory phospholipase A2-like [Perca flavescens]|uniref:group 3 secretory phospholipase A2-like n=1 Tax=Perca flavescens TaxID=8167 RepID=UPI00106EC2E0|nr:group 3 secretory phospholipase A2-like [Perca flavescens]
MQSVCLLQVVSTLSLLILSKAQPAVGSGVSCLRSSPAAAHDGHTRVTFLREDAAGVRALFLSLWSEDARPVTCEVNSDPLVTEKYRRLCDISHEVTRRFNISALLAPDSRFCAGVSSTAPKLPRREETAGRARRKRAWMFPGTLWCGTGSKALGYEQLGMFERADRCCREHDHCLHIIPSFTVNYGVFNPHFFTVSHCHCDQRFRQCLLGVNDTISSMVGYSFFNILRVPCFELKQLRRCTQMSWWGTCKVTKKALYAVFKKPLRYSSSDVTSKHGNNAESNALTSSKRQRFIVNPHRTLPKSEHRCFRDSPRGDTASLRRTKEKGYSQLLCRSLKHLDECKYKIHPLGKKFGLQNLEPQTAYHCDCTSCLAVQIKSFKKPGVLPALLMDFVSQFCFKLPEEKKCHRGTSCSGGFTPASDLLQALKLMEEKDTAGVRNSVNYRRRGIPARLYKRCLRLEREADVMAQHTRS